jgi:hypothetical protein
MEFEEDPESDTRNRRIRKDNFKKRDNFKETNHRIK